MVKSKLKPQYVQTPRQPNFNFMSDALYPLASLAQLQKSPSSEDGIPEDLEEDLRAYGCKLIHQAGVLLKQ